MDKSEDKQLDPRNFLKAAIAAIVVFVLMAIASWPQPVHALPEYAERTDESCATCHVNPGGGGPRTLRGALWAAKGKPDKVPALPGVLLSPGVTDGAELYGIACSTCHGPNGEGLFGIKLAHSGLGNDGIIRFNILKGRLRSGMPSFDGKFTDSQLQALVSYVVAMANGTIGIPPTEYPLEPPTLNYTEQSSPKTCGGN
jgi:mono/diheme cytochrome c family protein